MQQTFDMAWKVFGCFFPPGIVVRGACCWRRSGGDGDGKQNGMEEEAQVLKNELHHHHRERSRKKKRIHGDLETTVNHLKMNQPSSLPPDHEPTSLLLHQIILKMNQPSSSSSDHLEDEPTLLFFIRSL